MTLNSQLTFKILYILALTGSISNEETRNEDTTVYSVTGNDRNCSGQELNKGIYLGDELSGRNLPHSSDTNWSLEETTTLQNLTDVIENNTRNFSENVTVFFIRDNPIGFTEKYLNESLGRELTEGTLDKQKTESFQNIIDKPSLSGNSPIYTVGNNGELKLISIPIVNITDSKNESGSIDQNRNISMDRFQQMFHLNSTEGTDEYDQLGESSNNDYTCIGQHCSRRSKLKYHNPRQKPLKFTSIEPETPFFQFIMTQEASTEKKMFGGQGMEDMVQELNTMGPMMDNFFDQNGLLSDDDENDPPIYLKRSSQHHIKKSKENLIINVKKLLDKTREKKRKTKSKRETPKPRSSTTNKPSSPQERSRDNNDDNEDEEQGNNYDDSGDKLPGDDQNEILNLWDDYILGLSGKNTSEEYEHRIIGGRIIPVEQVPYLVVLLRFEREMCAGTLISPEHVLTAAHCVTALGRKDNDFIVLRPDDFTIRYGSNTSEYGGYVEGISYIFVHPEFLSNRKYHVYMDLSVLLLKNKLTIDDDKIARLPMMEYSDNDIEDMINSDARCMVAGWGKTVKPNHKIYKRSLLVGTNLNLINYNYCMDLFRVHGLGISPRAHVCTYTEGKDACQGDSGGGLYCNTTIWGVTSWGIGCADKDIPGVFARVDTNLEFINSCINWDKSALPPSSSLLLRSNGEKPKLLVLLLLIFEILIITNNYR